MSIKAIVFDFGKVISFPQEDSVMEELAAIAGLEVKTLDSLVWKYRGEYDRGVCLGKEYYRTILQYAGVTLDDPTLERMVQIDLNSWTRINPETVALMEGVKKAGYTLGILSNMPHDFLAMARASFPVFTLPDVGVFSCEVGFIKPEEAIYRVLLQRLSCEPAEVVFFDDIPINVDKAKILGIQAFLWQDPGTARRELKQAGISV
jgi:putative hydrolase of the HAD superfamily